MSDPVRDIDELFYKGIEEHSEYPADNVWNKIEADLDKNIATVYKRKYKLVRRNAWVLLILFIGIVFYEAITLYYGKEPGSDMGDIVVATTQAQPENNITTTPSDQKRDFRQYDARLENSKTFPGNQLPGLNTSNALANTTKNGPVIGVSASPDLEINSEAAQIDDDPDKNLGTFSAREHYISNDYAQANLLFSLAKITADDSWKKEIATGLKPAGFSPLFPLVDHSAKKLNYPLIGKSRFSVSVFFSPGAVWNKLKDEMQSSQPSGGGNGGGGNGGGGNGGGNNVGNNGGSGGRGDTWHEIKHGESENLAYSGGLQVSYDLNRRISLQTGLNYLITSVSIKPKLIYAVKDSHGNISYRINCSSGYSFLLPKGTSNLSAGDSAIVYDTRNSVSYVGIPLTAEYRILSSGKFSLATSAGAEVNLLLKARTSSVFGKGTSNETTASNNTEGLKTAYLSALASLTAEWRIKNNLSFTLAPSGQFGLSYMNKGTSVRTRPNYLGLAAGLKLKL